MLCTGIFAQRATGQSKPAVGLRQNLLLGFDSRHALGIRQAAIQGKSYTAGFTETGALVAMEPRPFAGRAAMPMMRHFLPRLCVRAHEARRENRFSV
jgi:hypothetical protein